MQSYSAILLFAATTFSAVIAAPQVPFGVTYDNGKLGVNFFGFNAAVGIGGQLHPNGTGGGLFAEAGTPFGQRAIAGLGGNIDGRHMGGGLYAGATAGGNIKASAGLNGDLFNDEVGSSGRGSLYSSASAGPAKTGKTVEKEFNSEGYDVEEYQVKKVKNTKVNEYEARPAVTKHEFMAPAMETHNEVQLDSRHGVLDTSQIRVIPVVVRKKGRRAFLRKQAHLGVNSVGYGTAHLNAYLSPNYQPPAPAQVFLEEPEEKHIMPTYHSSPPSRVHVEKEVVLSKQHRPDFFQDIFNIPISTLGAVSRFLSNSASANSGSIDIRKSVRYE